MMMLQREKMISLISIWKIQIGVSSRLLVNAVADDRCDAKSSSAGEYRTILGFISFRGGSWRGMSSSWMRLMKDINSKGLYHASRSREEFVTPN
jgi:hypothetical protein